MALTVSGITPLRAATLVVSGVTASSGDTRRVGLEVPPGWQCTTAWLRS